MNFLLSIDFNGLIASLAGAFLGAVLAFKYERRLAKDDLDRQNRSELIKTQLLLISQLNSVANISETYMPLKEDMTKGPFLVECSHDFVIEKFDITNLSFLIDHNEGDTITENDIAQAAYSGLCAAVEDRNKRVVATRDASTFISMNDDSGKARFNAPPEQVKLLTDSAKVLFEFIERSQVQLTKVTTLNAKVAKRLFPGKKFPTPLLPEKTKESSSA